AGTARGRGLLRPAVHPGRHADPGPSMSAGELPDDMHGLLDDVGELVSCESPSADVDAVTRCADLVDAVARRRIDVAAERVIVQGRPHLRWQFGTPRVVLVGHLDTVWP